MNWLFLSIAALVIAAVALRRYKPWLGQILHPDEASDARQPALRKVTPLDRMIDTLKHEKDPLERHRLLSGIVDESYRQRGGAAMSKVFLRFAEMHVKELPKMAAALKAAHGGKLLEVPAFTLLAETLGEDGRLEDALAVCLQAEELGLNDGTKAGFTSRIRKLQKRIKDNRPSAKRPSPGTARIRGKRKA